MLRDILSELSEAISIPATSAENRAQLLRYINRAYYEYYSTADLPGALFEQTFLFTEDVQQVSLPWYVDQVRLMRRALTRTTLQVETLAPRYHSQRWQQPYRQVRFTAVRALHTPLTLASQLTVTLAIAQTKPLSVTVTGQTSAAASVTETLTFLPGDLTKTTTAQFVADNPIGISSISKNAITTCDVVVRDGAGTEIALIPSMLNQARHVILMTNDFEVGQFQTEDNQIEILYKRVFIPVYNDEDEFCTPALESAILWKARSYAYSMAKDETSAQQAILAEQKANDLAAKVLMNLDQQAPTIMSIGEPVGVNACMRQFPLYGRGPDYPYIW